MLGSNISGAAFYAITHVTINRRGC